MTDQPDLASPVADRMLAALPAGSHEDFDITALDRVGLPVHAASSYPAPGGGPDGVRDAPAGGIGYGPDPLAARLSALGEMTESAQLSRSVRRSAPETASTAAMRRRHGADAVVDPVTLPVDAGADVDPDRPLRWLPLRRWSDGAPGEQVWVPAEAVAVSGDDVPGGAPEGGWLVTPITNGLGAGQDLAWAVGHGLLELLQRDGNGLRFRALDAGDVVDLGPGREQLRDPVSLAALAAFDAAGVEVTVKLASVDLGVVNVYAVGAERPGGPEPVHPLVVTAAGEGTHPDREVAVRKALLELAASRVRKVFTHGPVEAVDVLAPDGYRARWEAHHPSAGEERTLQAMREWLRLDAEELRALVAPTSFGERTRTRLDSLPTYPWSGPEGWADLTPLLVDRLAGQGLDVLVHDASPDVEGLHAVKVVVPGLEVETLSYGRIGERGAARLLARAEAGDEQVRGLLGRWSDAGVPEDAADVRLTAAATERLGGPVWFSRAAAAALVGPLFPLYREPGRHLAAR
ncbi:YcaO-like family protein [Aquipuribacter hungaricus]|uniref:YcaO-like family protein n=1 Tax=Aquipuribacter hungaricus TaxID=545624 RepID=A0ABV7WIW3_9MICO